MALHRMGSSTEPEEWERTEAGLRLGTSGDQHSGTACGRWDGIACQQYPSAKLRAGEWDRMNRVCAAFISTYSAKHGSLIPWDAAAPDLEGGKLC